MRSRLRRLVPALAAAAVVVSAATGCAAPRYHFVASQSDDVVIRIPRTWNELISRVPPATTAGATTPAGSWVAVYDGAPRSTVDKPILATRQQPFAYARTVVVTKDEQAAITDDQLRDFLLPVTASGRLAATMAGSTLPGFKLLADEPIKRKTATGFHEVFSSTVGNDTEVFDELILKASSKTRVHAFLVHCTQTCYDTQRRDIDDAVLSFTVKTP